MTRDEILNMPAGREMDALVAEKVIGIDLAQDCDGEFYNEDDQDWSCVKCGKTGGWGDNFQHTVAPRPYSTSILWAWEVVLRFMNDGWCPNLVNDDNGHWALSFEGVNNIAPCTSQTSFIKYPELWCDTAPLAICRAALLAMEGR